MDQACRVLDSVGFEQARTIEAVDGPLYNSRDLIHLAAKLEMMADMLQFYICVNDGRQHDLEVMRERPSPSSLFQARLAL